MLAFWIAAGGAVVVLLLAAIAGAGKFGDMPDPIVDSFMREPSGEPIGPQDLLDAQFATVFRGFSPEQVNRLLREAAAQWGSERPSEGASKDGDGPADEASAEDEPPSDEPGAELIGEEETPTGRLVAEENPEGELQPDKVTTEQA